MTNGSQNKTNDIDAFSSEKEKAYFNQLRNNFQEDYAKVYPDKLGLKTIVIIPSLTLDQEILDKIDGVVHYEERLLCMLMLLRMPRAHVIYVSSSVIDPVIIDYYLHLLPGITGYHARKRLHLLSCYDASHKSLTEKILARPRLIERIKNTIPEGHVAHMACFNVTELERTLSVKLSIPLYGCDPDNLFWGTKSGSREIFRDAGLQMPEGFENLKTIQEITASLFKLKQKQPALKKAVIKLNDGFSGDGNAIFPYPEKAVDDLEKWIIENLKQNLKIVASELSAEKYLEKFGMMGGIVEEFIDGIEKISPSVQCKIDPLGEIEIVSTHDQILGGESDQVYLGANFPASPEYAVQLAEIGRKIANKMKDKKVLGRFAIDFISVKENNNWIHYPIEINLRKGGTTHPFLMLQFLTDGLYNEKDGKYYTSKGHLVRYYFCSDNLKSEKYIGLVPQDLIDIAMVHDLHYDGTSQEGVMFHLIGALSQYGKLGVVCIGSTPDRAKKIYEKIISVLDNES